MIIGDGGGGDGGGGGSIVTQAPDCGADHSALPFPKRVNLCGPDIHAWSNALVIPDETGQQFGILGSSNTDDGSRDSLISLDATGLTQWKVYAGEPDLTFNVSAVDNQVSAYGERPDDGMLVFGAFDTAADLTPAYEVQTPITSEETKLFGLRDGRTVVMQAFDGSVELFVVGNHEQLDWGKTFSSAAFSGLPSSGILGPGESRTSSVTATANAFIITVTKSNIAIAGASLMADYPS